jgi:hypothetical protein
MKPTPKTGVILKTPSIPRRYVSGLILSYCRTRTLRSFEELAEISHSFAVYLRDKGSLETSRAGDVAAALRRNGEPKLADDFTLAYLKDHIPPGEEGRVSIDLKREEPRPVKEASAKVMLQWLTHEIGRDPVIRDLVAAAYQLAHR